MKYNLVKGCVNCAYAAFISDHLGYGTYNLIFRCKKGKFEDFTATKTFVESNINKEAYAFIRKNFLEKTHYDCEEFVNLYARRI